MGDAAWATLTGLPPVWSMDYGFNYEVIFNYVFWLLVSLRASYSESAGKIVDFVIGALKATVNSIKFKVPGTSIVIDFAKYTWDDELFDKVGAAIKDKVISKQDKAREIKVRYSAQIDQEADPAKKQELIVACRGELVKLTDESIGELKTQVPAAIWNSFVAHYGATGSLQILKDKIAVAVVGAKNGIDPSMTTKLKEIHGLIAGSGPQEG